MYGVPQLMGHMLVCLLCCGCDFENLPYPPLFSHFGYNIRLGLSERYSCNPYNPLTDGPRSSGGYYLLQSTLQYLVTSIPRLRCSVVVLWAAPRTVLYLCSATLLFVCPLLPGVVAWRGASHESHLTTAASLVSFAQEAVNFGSRSALVYSLLLLMLPLRSPLTSAPDRPAS